ncbi:two-component regulator propeller domain-containing protein [uncultured Alistipes sp.]|uniref:two-component regulator propeller domain-containing protein n=1 Tax=uncultured Alistipes sp. TaxID=538949 RepID=UPI0026052766|nr:two-component regulator propeller domain-containing protein [uncultured Alistipes sp.]
MKQTTSLLRYGLLWLLLLPAVVRGAAPQTVIEKYSTLDGLTHNRISDIYTDSEGFVWICTWYGVSRFDGYSFKNYSTKPGDFSPLSHNRFLSVSEDANGHLWFTTYNRHIYRFNRSSEEFEDPLLLLAGVDGKHCRTTHCLHDGRGGTWVAIPGVGLFCFDDARDGSPLRVRCRIHEPALEAGVETLYVDSSDNVWAAADSGELYCIRPDGAIERTADLTDPVIDVTVLGESLYFLTESAVYCRPEAGADLLRMEGGTGDWTAFAADPKNNVLYAGTRRGELFSADHSGRRLTPVTPPRGPRIQRIRYLKTDSHGLLWIATPEAGITRYSPRTNDFRHFEQEPYTVSYNVDTLPAIAEGNGRLWIKMNRYGFGYYDRERDRVEPFYNDPGSPDCQMTNAVVRFNVQGDVLWLTTYYERGLRRALMMAQPAEEIRIDSRFADEMSGEVRAMMTDRAGRVWMGTKSGELLCYSADRKLLYSYPEGDGEPLGMIYALKEDSRGDIWVGTKGNGLYRLCPGEGRYRFAAHYRHDPRDEYSLGDDQIYSIEEDDFGRLWFATYGGGPNLLDPAVEGRFIHAGNQLVQYPLDEADRMRWLLNDGNGRMLAATVDGLVVFEPKRSVKQIRFSQIRKVPGDASSLGNNDIIHMTRDSRGRVWLATYGGGLNRIEGYDESGMPRFRYYDQNDGLPSNICLSVVEDRNGNIWTATQNAVSRLDEEHNFFMNYLYNNPANVGFNESGALASPSGSILFARGNLLYAFSTDDMAARREDSRLRFTGFWVKNQPAGIGPSEPLKESVSRVDRIELKYNYSNFRFAFASLNYALQSQINYMYRLEGFDPEWNLAGKSNWASYSNVPTGHYKFQVKAYVGNVAAADEGLSVDVVILPPIWLTWWAKCLYILLVGAMLLVAWRIVDSMQRMRRESKMEQEMTDMKLQFFTNVSHELRTPLTLILGGIEDVRKHEELTPRGGTSLNLAYKNARRMLTLINQLLDFRKIVKNKMELKIARVNLVQLVEDAMDDFREMASERHIELLFTVSNRSILVWIDLERIESVVYNLLSNAFKFTRNGGRIEMVLTVNESEGAVSMTVRDNGIGIAKEQQGSIFERFHQASRSVVSDMKGSGIGLALCREIVALHQGEISVESKLGEGSAFTVRLRLGNAHFGMEQIDFGELQGGKKPGYMVSDYSSAESERRTDVVPPEDSQKILLVDDNRELRLFMYNSLIENYRVVEAEDGVEALEVIRREMPDIVVTDLMMPNMDGIELIGNIRRDFSISHIPVVMLTAKHSPDERIKAMEYGADGYITKPFSIELLQARIDNLLTQRRTLFEKFSTQSARNKVVELSPKDVVVTDRDEAFMKNVMAWLGENIENSDLTIDQLATHLGLGRTTMYNKLKGLTGKSPVELIKEYRINKSQLLLRTGQFSVSEVAYKVGFSDPGYFSRCFREQFNMSPAEYLKNHNLKNAHDSK